MKVAYSSNGFSFSVNNSKLLLDPKPTKAVSGADGVFFTTPHEKESSEVIEKYGGETFIPTGAGEYEVGDMLIHSIYGMEEKPFSMVHRISTYDIHSLFIGFDMVKHFAKEKRDFGRVNSVVVAYRKGETTPQDIYSFILDIAPQIVLFFDTDGSGKKQFESIAGTIEEAQQGYTIKKRDIQQEGMALIYIS